MRLQHRAVRSAGAEQAVEHAVAVMPMPVATRVGSPMGREVRGRNRTVIRRTGHMRDDQRQLAVVQGHRAVTRTDIDDDAAVVLLDHGRLALRVGADLGRFRRMHVLPFRGRQ